MFDVINRYREKLCRVDHLTLDDLNLLGNPDAEEVADKLSAYYNKKTKKLISNTVAVGPNNVNYKRNSETNYWEKISYGNQNV